MKKTINVKLEHIPYLISSAVCGLLVGALIFIFKSVAASVITLSGNIYGFVREKPVMLPILMIGSAILGLVSSLILRKAPEGKGGGIPSAIAVLRGLVSFNWVKSLFSMFTSAMLTYFCAVPLGNEGPSVQMGTALGRGCVRLFSRGNAPFERYIMTGGACAGFAAATAAPLTGVLFAFEEAHKRFSPLIFCVSSVSAVSACISMNLLCELTSTPYTLFNFSSIPQLPVSYMPSALVVGVMCGLCALLLSWGYDRVREVLSGKLGGVPFSVKVVFTFVVVSLIGFVSADFIGSGHHLVEELVLGEGVWYFLILALLVRAVLLLFANNIGVTGGLFVPTLAFGALSGAIAAKLLVSLHLIPLQYYSVCVIIGVAAVLAAFSHTPLMAIAFSLEALGAARNILPIIIGVTVAYLMVEKFARAPFTDLVIEAKAEDAHKGKTAHAFDAQLVANPGSFIIGKEIRDILWPPMLVVRSIEPNQSVTHRESDFVYEGDILLIHMVTYDLDSTVKTLESYLGKQSSDCYIELSQNKDIIPEI